MAKIRSGDADSAGQGGATTDTQPKTPAIPLKSMYFGPSFALNGALYQRGQIFNNGIPVPWLEVIAEVPEFRLLLVPIAKVPKAMLDAQNPQSALSLAVKKVNEYVAKKRSVKNG